MALVAAEEEEEEGEVALAAEAVTEVEDQGG